MKVTLSVKEVKLRKPESTIARIRSIKKDGVAEAWALQDYVLEYVKEVEYKPGSTEIFENYQQNGLGLGCYADDMLVAYIFAIHSGENRYGLELGYSAKEVSLSIDICEVVVHPDYWGNGLRMLLIGVMEDIAKQVGLKKSFAKCIDQKESLDKLTERGYSVKGTDSSGQLKILEKIL